MRAHAGRHAGACGTSARLALKFREVQLLGIGHRHHSVPLDCAALGRLRACSSSDLGAVHCQVYACFEEIGELSSLVRFGSLSHPPTKDTTKIKKQGHNSPWTAGSYLRPFIRTPVLTDCWVPLVIWVGGVHWELVLGGVLDVRVLETCQDSGSRIAMTSRSHRYGMHVLMGSAPSGRIDSDSCVLCRLHRRPGSEWLVCLVPFAGPRPQRAVDA